MKKRKNVKNLVSTKTRHFEKGKKREASDRNKTVFVGERIYQRLEKSRKKGTESKPQEGTQQSQRTKKPSNCKGTLEKKENIKKKEEDAGMEVK